MIYLQSDHQVGTDPVLETGNNEVKAGDGEGQQDELTVSEQALDPVPGRLVLQVVQLVDVRCRHRHSDVLEVGRVPTAEIGLGLE